MNYCILCNEYTECLFIACLLVQYLNSYIDIIISIYCTDYNSYNVLHGNNSI